MSEQIKISVVMDDEKPNALKNEKSTGLLILTQETDMTLMSVLLRNRLMEGSFCGGRGDCGRCVIQFLEGAPLPTGLERARLTPEELRQGYRLACVAKPRRDCKVRIPSGGDISAPIVTEVNLPSEIVDSSSQIINLSVNQKPNVTEWEQNQESVMEKPIKKSSVISKNEASVMKISRNKERTGNIGFINDGCYIVAVDLGTTTIAMQLRDRETGEIIDTYCEQNPQRSYGTDVLSRIEASCNGGREELQKLVCEVLARGLRQFKAYLRKQSEGEAGGRNIQFSGNGEESAQILCMCIAGNTTMEHLLLGYDVESLGKAPFVPVETGLQKILFYGELPVYIAPCISAFVGGDIVAGLYALRMIPALLQGEKTQAVLLIDLGTNGEMAMTDGRSMIVTATAAGPAFEGRGDLIGTDRIALTAELLRRGILDETGLMAEPYFETGVAVGAAGKIELAENRRKTADTGEDMRYFKQEDIRALQMAKAAVRAGMEILWEEMGRPEIGQVYLAGGFGYYLDVEAAFAIGLLPSYMRGRVQAVGNISLAGAYKLGRDLSLEETVGESLEKKLSEIESINLAKKEKFGALYLKYMNLEEN